MAIINSPRERAYLASLAVRSTRATTQSSRSLSMTRVGSAPPSVLYELDPNDVPVPSRAPSVNFPAVGFGVLRVSAAPDGKAVQNLTLSYGPEASHGHPDKLHIDLYALGDVLMPSPGIYYPYIGNRFIDTWYHTTLAHNSLTVDEKSQAFQDRHASVHANQTVFAPAERFGVQRASSDSAYPDVTMDRAVFVTTRYLADLFGAFSDASHRYDLAWHIRGALASDLDLKPVPFPEPAPNGYNALVNMRRSRPTEGFWSATFALSDRVARLPAAGGTPTEAIVGEGGVYVDEKRLRSPKSARRRLPR